MFVQIAEKSVLGSFRWLWILKKIRNQELNGRDTGDVHNVHHYVWWCAWSNIWKLSLKMNQGPNISKSLVLHCWFIAIIRIHSQIWMSSNLTTIHGTTVNLCQKCVDGVTWETKKWDGGDDMTEQKVLRIDKYRHYCHISCTEKEDEKRSQQTAFSLKSRQWNLLSKGSWSHKRGCQGEVK